MAWPSTSRQRVEQRQLPKSWTKVLLTLSLFIAACSTKGENSAAPNYVELDRTTPGAPSSYIRLTLCEFVARVHSAGFYEVTRIVGATEYDTRNARWDGFTYVHIVRHDAWTNDAPERELLRLLGGPLPNGITKPTAVYLERGKSYGMILSHPHELNDDHRGVGVFGLFPKIDGRLTNEIYLPPEGWRYEAVKSQVADAFDGCRRDLVPYGETLTEPDGEGPGAPAEEQVGALQIREVECEL